MLKSVFTNQHKYTYVSVLVSYKSAYINIRNSSVHKTRNRVRYKINFVDLTDSLYYLRLSNIFYSYNTFKILKSSGKYDSHRVLIILKYKNNSKRVNSNSTDSRLRLPRIVTIKHNLYYTP